MILDQVLQFLGSYYIRSNDLSVIIILMQPDTTKGEEKSTQLKMICQLNKVNKMLNNLLMTKL